MQIRPSFLHKGFTVTPLEGDVYQVTPPNGKPWPKLFKGKEAVRAAVWEARHGAKKDGCSECSMHFIGPLMLREDGYHCVCNHCAAVKYPKHWAYRRKMGWYPRTIGELESGELEQGASSNENQAIWRA